jgi:hypothetical protein
LSLVGNVELVGEKVGDDELKLAGEDVVTLGEVPTGDMVGEAVVELVELAVGKFVGDATYKLVGDAVVGASVMHAPHALVQ